ncbi:ATP-binding cassette sub-family C member 4-like [Bubalus kerabau]|uniref:ATP-binding cassette sub-family C member 4-like n=1 Tax=Bubalus carabanensis TaxID=3119969 RepID=UPI00244E8786|nr:ATP-binding cassette sub-family C member 4-like [Bubalus carabanensis]
MNRFDQNFLLLDEITQCYPLLPSNGKTIVDVQAFTASWEKASETPTLQELSFTVRPGELLAVVGPVGAGKSSLLRNLLGELPLSQGKVSVLGRITYVFQQPWVFPGTVKSNILFGMKYEKERYEEVIKACALEWEGRPSMEKYQRGEFWPQAHHLPTVTLDMSCYLPGPLIFLQQNEDFGSEGFKEVFLLL